MAKTKKIRAHLVCPEQGAEQVTSAFRDRFHLAYGQFTECIKDIAGETILSTQILEDGADHRDDLREIHSEAAEAFPQANVLLTEQPSTRNRSNESLFAYSHDVIIRICNTHPDAPQITRRIGLTDPKIHEFKNPYRDGTYVILTDADDADFVAVDIETGAEVWRQDAGDVGDKLSQEYSFDAGIVQRTRSNHNALRLLSWDDGTVEWEIEDPTPTDDSFPTAQEPVVSAEAIYVGSSTGTLHRVDVTDGTVDQVTTLPGEIRAITCDGDSVYVTTATEREADAEDDDGRGGIVAEEDEIDPEPERAVDFREKDEKSRVGAPTTNMTRALTRPSYDFSLRALSGDQVQWTAHFDEGGRTGSRPWLTSDTVVTEANGVLRGVDRKQGAERWSLTNDDIESEIKIRPPLSSSSSGKLKILNVIRDTVYCVTRFGTRQDHSALVAIDGRTGEITWTNQDYNASPYTLAVAHEHDDTIVFNNRENDLVTSFVALDQDSGTEAWQFAAPGTTGGDRSIGSEFVFVTSEECIVFDA